MKQFEVRISSPISLDQLIILALQVHLDIKCQNSDIVVKLHVHDLLELVSTVHTAVLSTWCLTDLLYQSHIQIL